MTRRHTIEHVRERTMVIAPTYTLLSPEYVNNRTPLEFRCPEGHEFKMSWDNFVRGQRCAKCQHFALGIARRHTIEHVRERTMVIAPTYTLLSPEYVNNKSLLEFRCPQGHEFKMRWKCFLRGSRCPSCVNLYRREEACREIIEELTGHKFPEAWTLPWLKSPITNRNLRLDCYNPGLKLALEHRGIQHYLPTMVGDWERSGGFERQRLYDKFKLTSCIKHGIFLIIVPYTVPDDELRAFIGSHVTRWLSRS